MTKEAKVNFYNDELKNIVEIAKNNGLQVWTFTGSREERSKQVKQVFVSDGVNIGSICTDFSGVRFSTVNKPCRECGTGFGIDTNHKNNTTIEDIKASFITVPNWATKAQAVAAKKYKNWDEYLKTNTILKYYQI